jgi:hypothetical protein
MTETNFIHSFEQARLECFMYLIGWIHYLLCNMFFPARLA